LTVFGASGNTGSVVARRLLDAGKRIRVVVRDVQKVAALRSRGAEVVAGDVTDAKTVASALAGAEGAYLLTGATQWIELSGPREYSFADAAAAASQILGRSVKATPLPLDDTVPALTQLGFSQNVAALYREMLAAFGSGVAFEGKGRSVRGKVPLADVLRAGLR
jgi:uncharacterized protein YbjT (DUF2867 family)